MIGLKFEIDPAFVLSKQYDPDDDDDYNLNNLQQKLQSMRMIFSYIESHKHILHTDQPKKRERKKNS
jgi:hypothetical protein